MQSTGWSAASTVGTTSRYAISPARFRSISSMPGPYPEGALPLATLGSRAPWRSGHAATCARSFLIGLRHRHTELGLVSEFEVKLAVPVEDLAPIENPLHLLRLYVLREEGLVD